MAISFNPGQAQPGTPASAPVEASSSGAVSAVDSYIPKAVPTIATQAAPEDTSPFVFMHRTRSSFAVYFQLGIILIFTVIVITVIALFAYQGILNAQVTKLKEELAAKQQGFPKLPVAEMDTVYKQIKVANTVLSEQASVRTAFRILEESVSNSVTYNKFSLAKNKNGKGYNLSFAGETAGYENLYQQITALQSKIFAAYFTKLIISGIGPLDKKGIGTFKVDTVVAIEGIYPENFTLKEKDEYLKSLLPPVETQTGAESTTGEVVTPIVQ